MLSASLNKTFISLPRMMACKYVHRIFVCVYFSSPTPRYTYDVVCYWCNVRVRHAARTATSPGMASKRLTITLVLVMTLYHVTQAIILRPNWWPYFKESEQQNNNGIHELDLILLDYIGDLSRSLFFFSLYMHIIIIYIYIYISGPYTPGGGFPPLRFSD